MAISLSYTTPPAGPAPAFREAFLGLQNRPVQGWEWTGQKGSRESTSAAAAAISRARAGSDVVMSTCRWKKPHRFKFHPFRSPITVTVLPNMNRNQIPSVHQQSCCNRNMNRNQRGWRPTSTPPGARPASTPSGPRTVSRTSAGKPTMVNTTSLCCATCRVCE